jgi:RNA polymerase sigma factor (sigma-70 family)
LKDFRAAPDALWKREMATKLDEFIPTRASLLSRLKSLDDQESWRDFFNTYWKLIYSVALKRGLNEQEAQEVVQETIISVAKTMADFKYNPAKCSFKGWLRHLTDKRIADQFRKRNKNMESLDSVSSPDTDFITFSQRTAAPAGDTPDALWEQEWKQSLLEAAIENVKRKVSPKQFRLFYRCAVEGHSASDVARTFEVNIAQVYLAKHRVGGLVKKEVKSLELKMG